MKIKSLLLLGIAAQLPILPIASQTLTFDNAYEIATTNCLDFKIKDAQISASVANGWQARALPNPTLSVNLCTIGHAIADDENQLTVTVSQLVELGGKRSIRINGNAIDQIIAHWDVESQKLNLKKELLHDFIDIAALQESWLIDEKLYEIAKKQAECDVKTLPAEKTSPLEIKKKQLACQSTYLQRLKREQELKKAKNTLFTRLESKDFDGIDFDLFEAKSPSFPTSIAENPEVNLGRAKLIASWWAWQTEKAAQIPDVNVQVGVTTQKFTQDAAFNAGFSMPLPIFNRNQGGVQRAICDYNAAFFGQEQLEKGKKILAELHFKESLFAYEQFVFVRDHLMPLAKEAYDLAKAAHDEKKMDYLDLLDAEASLLNTKGQLIDAAKDYHHKVTEL